MSSLLRMRPGLELARFTALVLALLVLAGGVSVSGLHPAADAEPCEEACPSDDDCGDDDFRCGCCAGVVPAVVPLRPDVAALQAMPAPGLSEPPAPTLSVIQELFDPPRRLVV